MKKINIGELGRIDTICEGDILIFNNREEKVIRIRCFPKSDLTELWTYIPGRNLITKYDASIYSTILPNSEGTCYQLRKNLQNSLNLKRIYKEHIK